jgi:outer membrane protein TolC
MPIKRRRKAGIFLICCFLALPLGAEGLPSPLTWQDCVAMAVRHNPNLLAAQETMEQFRSQFKGSFNGILPQVSLSNSYTDSSSSHVGVGGTGTSSIISDESKVWTAGGNVSMDLVDFGQWSSIQTALNQYHQYQANLEVAANNALLSLYQAFAALLYAQEEVQVNTDIRDTWKMNADMVALRYQSGTESKGDNMNTQAQLQQAGANLTQASRDILVAQQQLSTAMGLDEFQMLVVTGTWVVPPAPDPPPNFEALLEKEPAVKLQAAVVAQAQSAVHTAWAPLLPTLGVNYSRGRSGDTELPNDPYWTFTGTLHYSLFSSGLTSTYYNTQAAKRSLESARQQLRAVRTQTLNSLVSAWSGYAQAQDQVKVQGAFLEAGRQRKKEYDVLYRGGLETFEEWLLIAQDYVNFQTNFLKAEQSLMQAQAQWRFASGEQLH